MQKIATGGFGDFQNSYSWSMAWFKGKLYVGTARSFHCVEAATLDFYYPGQGYYNGPLDGLPPEQRTVPPATTTSTFEPRSGSTRLCAGVALLDVVDHERPVRSEPRSDP